MGKSEAVATADAAATVGGNIERRATGEKKLDETMESKSIGKSSK